MSQVLLFAEFSLVLDRKMFSCHDSLQARLLDELPIENFCHQSEFHMSYISSLNIAYNLQISFDMSLF